MFIPIGLLGAKEWNWKIIPVACLFSATIELTQLLTRRGLFEFDDMIHNTLGAVIGFGVYMIGRTIWRHLRNYGEE